MRRLGALVTVVLAVSPVAGSAGVDQVALVDEDGTTLSEVRLDVPEDATEAMQPLAISWTPTDDPQEAAGAAPQALEGVSLSVLVVGVTAELLPAPGNAGYLIPAGAPLPLLLHVSGVDEGGTYGGFLLAEVGGVTKQLATVTVAKPEDPVGPDAIDIVGATDAGLAFATTRPSLRAPMTFFNSSNDEVTFDVVVTPFRSATGTTAEAMVDRRQVKLGAGASVTLYLTADLEDIGIYTSTITLAANGKGGKPVVMTVERTAPALPVTLEAVGPRHVTDKAGRATADVEFEITNNGGEALNVGFELGKVVRTEGDSIDGEAGVTASFSPCPDEMLEAESGEAPTTHPPPVTAVTDSTAPEGSDEADGAEDCLLLPANDTTKVSATLAGLPGPGQYTVKVRAGAHNRPEMSVDLQVFVKRPLGIAAFWIGLGVGLGAIVAFVLRPGKDRASRLVRLARAADRIKSVTFPEPLVDRYLQIHNTLKSRVVDLGSSLSDAGVEARLDSLERQVVVLPEWVRLAMMADAASVSPWPEGLLTVRQKLLADEMSDAQETEAATALGQVEARLVAESEVGPKLRALRKATHSWLAQASPDDATFQSIASELDKGDGFVRDGKPTDAHQAWFVASHAWRTALITNLQPRTVRPSYVDAATWEPVAAEVNRVIEHLTAHSADPTETWRTVNESWMKSIDVEARGLVARVDQMLGDSSVTPKQKQDLEVAKRTADDAIRAIRLADAEKALGEARRTYEKIDQPVRAARRIEKGIARLAPAMEAIGPAPPEGLVRFEHMPSIQEAKRRLGRLEAALVVVVLVGTLALGLTLVYAPDPTWGDWQDAVAAILWGLGLSSASTFTGVEALRKSILEPGG